MRSSAWASVALWPSTWTWTWIVTVCPWAKSLRSRRGNTLFLKATTVF